MSMIQLVFNLAGCIAEERLGLSKEVRKILTSSLFEAIREDNANKVKILLFVGIDVNARDGNLNQTPLMLASRFGYLKMVKILIESGADVNAKDMRGWTALTYAVETRKPEIASTLIKSGSNITSMYSTWGQTYALWRFSNREVADATETIKKQIDQFFEAIRSKDIIQIQIMLEKDPWLINAYIYDGKARDLAKKQGIDLDILLSNIKTKQESILSKGTIKKPKKWKRVKKQAKRLFKKVFQ